MAKVGLLLQARFTERQYTVVLLLFLLTFLKDKFVFLSIPGVKTRINVAFYGAVFPQTDISHKNIFFKTLCTIWVIIQQFRYRYFFEFTCYSTSWISL